MVTSPAGTEVGKAYVTIRLDDQTAADYDKLKADLEKKADIAIGTKLKGPPASDWAKIREEAKRQAPIDLPPAKLPPIKAPDNSEVQRAFKQLADSIDQDSKQSQSSVSRMLTSTAAGWTALGALLSGPAVVAALGVVAGGFAAIGIAAEKSNPQVQQAFRAMKTEGTDVLQSSFQTLTPVITGALGQWTTAAVTLGPTFQRASAEIAPGLAIINNALVQGAQTDIPAFVSALGGATPLAQALAGGIRDLSNGVAAFFRELNFSEAEAGFAALASDVGRLVTVFGQVLNAVMPLGNAILSGPVPAVVSLAGHMANDLAPTIRVVAGAINALSPVLNFMSGPTAAVLIGVAAFKALQGAANALLPAFNTVSGAVTEYGNKLIGMAGGSNNAIGSFTLLTSAQQKQAVQAAASGLATAQQTAAQTANALSTLESAAAADASSVSQAQLAAARATATAAAEAETTATAALTTATEASSFAFGPVGIAVGGLAAVMALFSGNTSKASVDTGNFTQQLVQLAAAAPTAAQGIISSDPKMADFINKVSGLGVSYKDLTDAINGNAAAQGRVDSAFEKQKNSLGDNRESLQMLTEAERSNLAGKDSLSPALSNLAQMYDQYKTAVDQARANQQAANQVQGAAAPAVQLTAEQMDAAQSIAAQFGMSVNDVATDFRALPGAGSTAAGAVGQVASAFIQGEVKVKDAEQALTDYFTKLQDNADKANQALANANHSYEQSVQGVADAQHSYVQAQRAVQDADEGVVRAQRAVADANEGVIQAEHSLANAQYSEQQAQEALTQARADAVQQLRDLHLQLDDQVTAEQRARLELFKQVQDAAKLGITPDNAQAILAQQTTTANLAQQQAALDLIAAQQRVTDTLNSGAELRNKVNAADRQGVEQNPAVVSAAHALANAQDQVAQATQGVLKAQQAVVDAQQGVVRAQQAVSDAVYAEQRARQAVQGAIYSEQQALIAVRNAQVDATRANDLNTTSLDLNTQAGRNNYEQLLTLFNAFPAWMDQTQRYNAMIDATSTAFHGSRDAAADFLKQENLIPRDFKYGVTAVAQVDTSSYQQLMNTLIGGGSSSNQINSLGGLLGLPGHAEGGQIGGVGGPRDDSNLIRASKGEFMQPADSVQHYGVGFMEAIRQKKLPRGGDGAALPGYAAGGLIGGSVKLGLAGANYQANVNALSVMGFPHPRGLPEYVPPPLGYGAVPAATGDAAAAQAFASAHLAQFGWGQDQMPALIRLWNQESGWNAWAVNPSSGAYGIPQSLGHGHPFDLGDYANQVMWGLNYIAGRYGSPSAAWGHEVAYNWYDQGGYMLDRPGINNTGKPEMVLPPNLTETLESLNEAFHSRSAGGGTAIDYGALAGAVAQAVASVFAGGVQATWDTNALEKGLITLSRRRAGR